jgi:nucleoside-diphosphate-sugar epimerase
VTNPFEWSGRRVLVTGADGFIGSHLVEALLDLGARVIALTRGTSVHGTASYAWKNLTAVADRLEQVVAGNVAQAETVQVIIDLEPDVILHLAAEAYVPRSFERPGEVFAVNAVGTLHVLEAARRLSGLHRVVVTSSSEVYGTALGDLPISEAHPLNPTSPYAASKVAADRLAHSFHVTFGVPVAIVRPFNTFGPRHTYDVIPRFLRLALAGEDLIVHGSGEQRRDFTFVEDIVRGFLLMAAEPAAVGEVINLGTGVSHSIRETAEIIAALCDSPSRIVHDRARPAEVKHLLCDASKAGAVLGWRPVVSYAEGLRRNMEWERLRCQAGSAEPRRRSRTVAAHRPAPLFRGPSRSRPVRLRELASRATGTHRGWGVPPNDQGAEPGSRALSVPAMLAWLTSEEVVSEDGGVVSWVNQDHPGHRYPEVAGLLLSLLAGEGPACAEVRDRIVRGLAADLSAAGGLGKEGRDYAFDTAMVLDGLLRHEASGGRPADSGLARRLFGFLVRCLSVQSAIDPATGAQAGATRWSLSYGCHLLKIANPVLTYHEQEPDRRCPGLVDSLLGTLLPLYERGRFRTHDGSDATYLHAHCYAVEGLLGLEARGAAKVASLIVGAADWLAKVQAPNGGFRAWHDGTDAIGEFRTDATAQAVRVWACVDCKAFAGPIARALEFLNGMQVTGGGLRYGPGIDDVNTWATLFAVQAACWAHTGGDPSAIV